MSLKDPSENMVELAMNLKIQRLEELQDDGFCVRLDLLTRARRHFRHRTALGAALVARPGLLFCRVPGQPHGVLGWERGNSASNAVSIDKEQFRFL